MRGRATAAGLICVAALRLLAVDAQSPAALSSAEEALGKAAAARDLPLEAIAHFAKALEWAEKSGDSSLVGTAFESLAGAYFTQGQRDRVLELAGRKLRESAEDPNRPRYLLLRGMAYSEMAASREARQAFDEALPLAEEANDLRLAGDIHRNLGLWIWRYERNLPAAAHEFDQALACARKAKAWALVAQTLNNAGNPYRNEANQNLPEALRCYQEGLAIARREHVSTAHLLKNIGETYRMMADAGRAKTYLTEAIEVADRRNVEQIRWMARLEMGNLLSETDPERAERYFLECLDLLEATQNSLLLDDFRPGALAGAIIFANPYDQLIDFLVSRNRAEDAFLTAERQRARVFLDALSNARDTLARQAPAGFAADERNILNRIKTVQASLRLESTPATERKALVAELEREETELTDLRLRLAAARPALAQARFPKIWSVPEVQTKLLDADEALVSFYLGPKRSVAWVLTRERVDVVSLPAKREIEKQVLAALDDLRNPANRANAAVLDLSRTLRMDEISRLAARPRWTVIPHGILADLPFDALSDAQGRPLVEDFAVSYAPSASSLAFLRMQHPKDPAATLLLAVANPIVGDRTADRFRQSDLTTVHMLAPLPHSADEARQIASIFAGPFGLGGGAQVLEGKRATLSELRARGLDRARILHFATHGLVDENRPERSGLVLSVNSAQDDGLLQTRDIYSLRLDADLVTLSACETALGKNVTGEGMIGLTRAFFYAGSRAVVSSLWDIEDSSTATFMRRFYGSIRDGKPIDVALQQTKLQALHGGGATSSPFYWASFIVNGQARAVVDIPRGGNPGASAAIATLLLASLGAGWYYRKVAARR